MMHWALYSPRSVYSFCVFVIINTIKVVLMSRHPCTNLCVCVRLSLLSCQTPSRRPPLGLGLGLVLVLGLVLLLQVFVKKPPPSSSVVS